MSDMTYDPEADAVYLYVGNGKIDHQEKHGSLICDVDAEGRIVGIEVLFASRVLAPGNWEKAPLPGAHVDAAE
jgi:uncharacterized protein YuzE